MFPYLALVLLTEGGATEARLGAFKSSSANHSPCHPVVVLKCRLGASGASCKFKRSKIVALSISPQVSICLLIVLPIKLKLNYSFDVEILCGSSQLAATIPVTHSSIATRGTPPSL